MSDEHDGAYVLTHCANIGPREVAPNSSSYMQRADAMSAPHLLFDGPSLPRLLFVSL